MKRRGLTFFFLILHGLIAYPANAELHARASVNPQRAQMGEWITLSIEVTGTQGAPAPALDIPDFDVRYRGPSTQVSIVNGQMSSSVQHIYLLSGRKSGRFNLGPFTVQANGQSLATSPVSVEVVAPGQATNPAGGQAPLRLALSVGRPEVFLREKVPVEVTLWVGEIRATDLQYPSLLGEGFSIEKFAEPTQRQEIVDGESYQVLRFRTTLVPLRTGTLQIGPTSLTLNVADRRRGGIFDDPFFADRRPVTVRADSVPLSVLALPEDGRPEGFSGAVGRYSLDVSASPREVNVGDPVTVTMTVRGEGNVPEAPTPQLTDSSSFRTYDPKSSPTDGISRSFEQVLIPTTDAVNSIPSYRISFFNPDNRKYESILSPPIPLVVRTAQIPQKAEVLSAVAATPAAPKPEQLGRDLVFIKDSPGVLGPTSRAIGIWFWIWLPFPLASLLVTASWARRRRRLSGNTPYARFVRAEKEAKAGLAKAEAALRRNDAMDFYDLVARTLREYLAAKLDLPPGGVDPERVTTHVDASISDQVGKLLQTCEQMRFAPASEVGDLRVVLDQAHRVVRELERGQRKPPTNLLVVLGAVLLFGASAQVIEAASAPHTAFYRGNSAYSEGRFSEAVTAYQEILRSDLASAPLYFNLGNALFQVGQKGLAILSYERALRLSPGDPDTTANLNYARSMTQAAPCDDPLWSRVAFPLASHLPPTHLLWLVSAFYTLTCALLATRLFFSSPPSWLQVAAAVSASCCLAALANLGFESWHRDERREAIVTIQGGTRSRFQPDKKGTEHFVLPEGAPVTVLEERGDWTQVRRCDGRRGWVERASLERLAPPPHVDEPSS